MICFVFDHTSFLESGLSTLRGPVNVLLGFQSTTNFPLSLRNEWWWWWKLVKPTYIFILAGTRNQDLRRKLAQTEHANNTPWVPARGHSAFSTCPGKRKGAGTVQGDLVVLDSAASLLKCFHFLLPGIRDKLFWDHSPYHYFAFIHFYLALLRY